MSHQWRDTGVTGGLNARGPPAAKANFLRPVLANRSLLRTGAGLRLSAISSLGRTDPLPGKKARQAFAPQMRNVLPPHAVVTYKVVHVGSAVKLRLHHMETLDLEKVWMMVKKA
ncbi:hypothetical protein [Mesorhizobium sp. WSM4311]|uniref:hypothetical protein n=1 Tax=Mesorhizobium sp. WSM4311 TaxID=2029410 RepID=UPI001AED00B9|nr:hypothetical protein [Mesorhizobium sp. WSM4311]